MRTLQLTQRVEQGGHLVEVALSGAGARRTATARSGWELEPQDREDLRWYLEDYLQYPIEPAPVIAARVERRLGALGRELFAKVFEANPDTIRLWDEISPHLPDTRVEVATTVEDAAAIPWELLRDPATDAVLALRARAFVRTHPEAAQAPALPEAAGKIRVLLVICRPGGGDDVPFRSVASHLVRLSRTAREAFQLDVLRPPTFAKLRKALQAAKERGAPYHVVHFDGHGEYTDIHARPGRHGYLLFEKPGSPGNIDYIDGRSLGEVLADGGVPVLVLNACRSAHADLVTEPQTVDLDTHQRVRAYGSLAQEVIHAGVGGVVAMRYNVYVVTAARFVGDLYAALADGQTLGAAVTAGRTQLAAQPDREIAFAPRPLQDWTVPVVYEATPLALLAKPSAAEHLTITLDQAEAAAERAAFDPMLPADPDVGFYGRDETLLALDRAFDTQQIVLCTPGRAAARPRRRSSSPAGTSSPAAWTTGRCCSPRSPATCRWPGCSIRSGPRSGNGWKRPASTGSRCPTPSGERSRSSCWPRCRCCGSGTTSSRSLASPPAHPRRGARPSSKSWPPSSVT